MTLRQRKDKSTISEVWWYYIHVIISKKEFEGVFGHNAVSLAGNA